MSQDDESPRPRNRLVERWWWTGGLWSAAGVAVVWYQWPALSGQLDAPPSTAALIAVWVMAVVGAALALAGFYRLNKDWKVEKARLEAEAASAEEPDAAETGDEPGDDNSAR